MPSTRLAFGEGARPQNGVPGSSVFLRRRAPLGDILRAMQRVRAATHDDIGVMLSLWRELEAVQGAFRFYPVASDAEERIMASLRSAIDADDGDVLLVEDGNEAVGMALVRLENPSRMSAERAAELSRVVVRPDRRGTGAGRVLIDATEAWAAERGVRTLVAAIFVANEASREFWRAVGFEPWVERMVREVGAPGDVG
jgi:GNAT superfamily N-acetyltransferase